MKIITTILALLAIGLFSLSCDGEGEGTFSYPHPEGAEWTFSQYMLDTGTLRYEESNRWILNGTYNHPTAGTVQIFESYSYNFDTQQWEYISSDYMLVTSEEVRFYEDDSDDYDLFLDFPLEVGKEWTVSEETAKVIAQQDVSIPAGIFNNCYKIQYSDNGEPYLNIWLPSGVGGVGVQMEYIGFRTLKLSSYNLPS